MGREINCNDPIVIHSSIALLQERFRQLQRVKEMREERELTRLLAEPKQFNPIMHYEPSRSTYFHFLPPRSPRHGHAPVSLWPYFHQSRHADFQFKDTPLLISLRSKETPSVHASTNKFDNRDFDDVDTSLHL
ncbi:hypothetical protein CFOL_v3_03407 [Cephalotus follicularis]|uniref:Uncharacterized protein n=1 Tax=Cephalotus follicularis TaxID=3775 RepID=A0A1Q3AVU0_CEPFO|nr:hypothetical protein CFOL_v3_03407 [Cephalotus follicularis]